MQFTKFSYEMFKFVTILLCLGSALAADQDTYNLLVDETMFMATQLMVEYKLDTLKLPPFSTKIDNQKIGTWDSVTGTITTSGVGTVVNATGIHRNGDAKISLVGEDKMVINVNIFTDPMIATFMELDVDFSSPYSFSNTGGMQLKVGRNEVTLQITLQKATGVCKLSVDTAELTTLGAMDFLILPDTWWAEIKDKGLDVYMSYHMDNVKAAVNLYIHDILQGAIDKINPCQYLPF